jgi:thiol-disulfide isomerase/thioredoxin
MDRRSFVVAGTTSLVLHGASAKPRHARVKSEQQSERPRSAKLFAFGPLAANTLAGDFMTAPGLSIPDTVLQSETGPHRFSDLQGKVRLVTLWAEWCSGCLVVMPDLWALQQRYGGAKFEIVAVLSGSLKKYDVAQARSLLVHDGAGRMPLWVEPAGGNRVLKALAVEGGHSDLPCDLLVDGMGRIRGRSSGARMVGPSVDLGPGDVHNGQLTASGVAKLDRAQAAQKGKPQRSLWSTPEGDAFVKALIAGALA